MRTNFKRLFNYNAPQVSGCLSHDKFTVLSSAIKPPCLRLRYVVDEITGKLVPESISTSSSALKEGAAAGGGFNGGVGGMAGHRRQTAGPLDIVGYPGYEKLSAAERALCSEVRSELD